MQSLTKLTPALVGKQALISLGGNGLKEGIQRSNEENLKSIRGEGRASELSKRNDGFERSVSKFST